MNKSGPKEGNMSFTKVYILEYSITNSRIIEIDDAADEKALFF